MSEDLQNWRPWDQPCPECGSPTEIGDWWDDPPEHGGACIGLLYRCTVCDWRESQ